jgi:hypothetical protein
VWNDKRGCLLSVPLFDDGERNWRGLHDSCCAFFRDHVIVVVSRDRDTDLIVVGLSLGGLAGKHPV